MSLICEETWRNGAGRETHASNYASKFMKHMENYIS